MAGAPATSQRATPRDHRFHQLRVREVVQETADTKSFVLDVPPELEAAFAYEAGQFCTFRVPVDGEHHLRSYSMSSSPDVGDVLQVTVKRVPGGVVSNWMADTIAPGDTVEATCPAGVFTLRSAVGAGDLVAFCGGSGVTPILSLVKTALATTDRHVRVLYANRDRAAIIFADALDDLAAGSDGRLHVVHHLDVEGGFATADDVGGLLDGSSDADHYVCGPAPFMDLVESTLRSHGVEPPRIHIERFTPAEATPLPRPDDVVETTAATPRVTIDLDGKTGSTDHHPGTTILQTARQMGMAAPSSCEAGSCATCMARLVEGTVEMHVNNALTDEEVADGWVLTCQSVPTSPVVHVAYGFED